MSITRRGFITALSSAALITAALPRRGLAAGTHPALAEGFGGLIVGARTVGPARVEHYADVDPALAGANQGVLDALRSELEHLHVDAAAGIPDDFQDAVDAGLGHRQHSVVAGRYGMQLSPAGNRLWVYGFIKNGGTQSLAVHWIEIPSAVFSP